MSPTLIAKLASGMVTLCKVWRITRTDGVIMRFTDHDVAVTADAQLFVAGLGVKCSAIELNEGLEPSNLEITGFFSEDGITIQDYLMGKYSWAKVEVGFADWADSSEPVMWLVSGIMGSFKRDRLTFTAQLNGTLVLLDRNSAEATTPICRAKLGDARCKVNLAPFTYTGTVATVVSRRVFTVSSVQATGWLTYGTCKFTSGVNVGRRMEIKRQTAGEIELFLPMPGDVAVGDAIELVAGCDLMIATCKNKFNNVLNIRAEPYLPGTDRMMANQKDLI